ncbi:MAG: chemotaxis protein CheW [Acidobacteriaceae bacterium]
MIGASSAASREGSQEVCSLRVGGMLFAVPIARVLEILGRPLLQPVPLAPEFFGGLVHYRGEVLAAISLRRLLGMDSAPSLEDVLVFEFAQGPFGLLVDSVGEVLSVSTAEHEPNPSTLDNRAQAVFAGAWKLADRLLITLDPDRLDPVRLASALAESQKRSHARHAG